VAQVVVDPGSLTPPSPTAAGTYGPSAASAPPAGYGAPPAYGLAAAVPGGPPAYAAAPPGAGLPGAVPPPGYFGAPPGLPPVDPGSANASVGGLGPLSARLASGAPATQGGTINLTAERAGASGVRLTWTRLRGANNYAVYHAQGNTPLAFLVSSGSNTTTLAGLPQGITFSFQVRARDVLDNEFATSDTVTFEP
jgi:hypothetical protein